MPRLWQNNRKKNFEKCGRTLEHTHTKERGVEK